MVKKVDSFIRRLRWKAHHFCKDNGQNDSRQFDNFGFKTSATPPQNEYLNAFENDMYEMIRNIEFINVRNEFQGKLRQDLENIQSSRNILAFEDKSTNLYELSKESYEKLLHDNITQTYKKAPVKTKRKIDRESKKFAKNLSLDDKMECYSDNPAYITLKDHKENFRNNTKCRLINPSKSEVGLVIKSYLSNIIASISKNTKVNQWRNTSTVIDWFKNLADKQKRKFIKFDIAEFYPSISEDLLNKSLDYAKSFTTIGENVINTIKLARKSLLFSKDGTWDKKGGNELFDVTMGSFQGAEICELVSLYLLDKLSKLLGKNNVGLYRDDGLAAVKSTSGPVLDKMRKNIIILFKNEGLGITINTNLIETDFLDVTINLTTGKFFPYRKPNNIPLYINVKSNHPPSIIKDIPKMINKRLSDLSCNKEEFDKAKPLYEKSLHESGYKTSMSYGQTEVKNSRNRSRNIIWFNPPFSQNVKTNIGKLFLKLVKKHFPKHHPLHKIFNPNTVKLSYSWMSNMSNIIKQHNSNILSSPTKTEERSCNCRNKDNFPLDGSCLKTCIVYRADVIKHNGTHIYYGASDGEFKFRYNNHTKSFRNRGYEHETELSKHIWELKDNNTEFYLKWSIAAYASPYRCGTRRCDFCLTEKYIIARAEQKNFLNKRTELISKCRHRNKYILKNL